MYLPRICNFFIYIIYIIYIMHWHAEAYELICLYKPPKSSWLSLLGIIIEFTLLIQPIECGPASVSYPWDRISGLLRIFVWFRELLELTKLYP
jgi:hypothetical protein